MSVPCSSETGGGGITYITTVIQCNKINRNENSSRSVACEVRSIPQGAETEQHVVWALLP